MAYITLNNVYAQVATAAQAEHDVIDEYLSFDDPGARFSPAFQRRVWDGRVRLYKRRQGLFPAGLVSYVEAELRRQGHPVTVEDRRPNHTPPGQRVDSWLDPKRRQPDILDACLHHGRGVVKSPTGSGKTEVIVSLCATVPCQWVILVDMADNLHNIAQRYEKRLGHPAGVVGDGKFKPARVTVATFQTLNGKLNKGDNAARNLLLNAGGVVSDEVHVLPADSWARVMEQAPNAWWRLGFSATPLFGEARRRSAIIGMCGPQIIEVQASELQANGVLAQQTIRMVPFHQHAEGANYREVYANGVVKSHKRNALLVQLAKRAPKPCLLFVQALEHGKRLTGYLQAEGISARFLSGAASTKLRQQMVEQLVRGDYEVLVGSNIFKKAWDIPDLASAINGGGGRSIKDTLQRLGRILRVTDTKSEVEYWDVDDKGTRHLEKHAKVRREAYAAGGFEVAEIEQGVLPGLGVTGSARV